MLPDFPEFKNALEEAINRYVEVRIRQNATGISEVPARKQFEGEGKNSIARPNEPAEETEMVEIGEELVLAGDELRKTSLSDVLQHFDKLAERMAAKQARWFFESLDNVTKKTGNTVDAAQRPFGHELVFEVLEKISLEFRSDGTPIMPSMFVPPSMVPAIEEAKRREEGDADIVRRHSELIDRKKEEWRAREANRILVG